MGNTYQARGVIGNVGLPVSGGIIREEHLNNEFTNIIAAFNSGTGHSHNMSATFTGDATSVVQPYLTIIYIIKT